MELALSLSLCRPGGISLEQLVAGLFSAGEQGAWYDPSGNNTTWRRNRLTYTQEFDNAYWVKAVNTSVSADAGSAPDATSTADKLSISSVTSDSGLYKLFQLNVVPHTLSLYAKADGANFVYLFAAGGTEDGQYFNLTNGTKGNTVGSNIFASTITDVGSGWYRCSISFVRPSGNSYLTIMPSTTNATGRNSQVGTAPNGVLIWGAQLEEDSIAPTAYQRIITPEITYLSTVQAQPLLFQNAEGTLPVTEVEQPVGLMLDRRKGLALGSEILTNGDFSSGTTGWSFGAAWSVVSGKAYLNSTGSGAILVSTVNVEIGKWYKMSFDYEHVSGSNIARVGGAQISIPQVTGRYTAYFLAGVTTGAQFTSNSSVASYYIDNVTVKLLDGNHAYQTSTPARPHLRSRYNLLTYSEQFDNAAWVKNNATATANTLAAPDGTTTADTLAATSGNGTALWTITLAAVPYTFSVWLKRKTGTGTVEITVDGTTYVAQDITSDWARYTTTLTPSAGSKTAGVRIVTSGDEVYVWGAQLNLGSTAMSYQRIAAAPTLSQPPTYATTSTMGGEVFRPYLWFDAQDDRLFTAAIDFSATDEMTVCAGVSKRANGGTIAETSANANTNNGCFKLGTASSVSSSDQSYTMWSRGTATSFANTATTFTVPRTDVLTGQCDISSDTNILRVNGVQAVTSADDQGTGNYSSTDILNIGARPTESRLNGDIYALIVRGKASTAAQIGTLESYVAGKTGVTL